MPALALATSAPGVDQSDLELRLFLATQLIDPEDGKRCQFLGAGKGRILENARRGATLPLAEAVEQSQPGHTAMALPAADVIAIDFDTPHDSVQVTRLRVFKDELHVRGLVPIVTASGRAGHEHMWCVVENAAEREALRTLAATLKLGDRSNQRMRLPLGPHAEGLPVHLLYPDDVEAARRAVLRKGPVPRRRDSNPAKAASPTLRLRSRRAASERFMAYLRHGARAAGYSTRHEADFGCAMSFAHRGWTYQEWRELYQDPDHNAGSEKYRELGAYGEDYLEKTWTRAFQRAGAAPVDGPEDVVPLLSAWDIDALTRPWPGRTGATDQAVYRALVAVALPCRSLVLRISESQVVAHTGLSPAVVHRSLKRLREGGYYELVERGDWQVKQGKITFTASTRRLLPPPTTEQHKWSNLTTPPACNYCSTYVVPPHRHDLFTPDGLGAVGWQIASRLCPCHDRSAGEIAEMTGRGVSTVRERLKPCRASGWSTLSTAAGP